MGGRLRTLGLRSVKRGCNGIRKKNRTKKIKKRHNKNQKGKMPTAIPSEQKESYV